MQTNRRLGLEQEFFLVEEDGRASVRSDEFLERCEELTAGDEGTACYAPEFVMGLVEVSTPPVLTFPELERAYLENLRVALEVARSLGLRLYPLGTYPLPLEPAIREGLDYAVQVLTVGSARFVDAGRCAGTHLHLELATGTVDPNTGISPAASAGAAAEALNLHNLATALDPALISLTRSCPYFEGRATGRSQRTVHYRGAAAFGWQGVYTDLPQVGALLPYAGSVEELVRQQFARYEAWLSAMDQAGVEQRLFSEAGGDVLRPAWNPVRLNRQGTLEVRTMDSNHPRVTLTAAALIVASAERVRREGLVVTPDDGVHTFEVAGDSLLVPGFEYLETGLLRAAAEEPTGSGLSTYLDSVLEFAGGEEGAERLRQLRECRRSTGAYPTTETDILERFPTKDGRITEEAGLRLVLEACDKLESQVRQMAPSREGEPADAL